MVAGSEAVKLRLRIHFSDLGTILSIQEVSRGN